MSVWAPREELYAVLADAGIRTAVSASRLAPPGAYVVPGSPWLTAGGTLRRGSRRSTWAVVLVAGRVDAQGTQEVLGEMLDVALPALGALAHWTTPDVYWEPRQDESGNPLVAARLPMTTLVDTEGP